MLAGVGLAALVLASTGVGEVTSAAGQLDEPPYRDQAGAAAELAEARAQVIEAEAVLAGLEADVLRLEAERSSLDLATKDYAVALQASQERARRLAVEAYMTGNAASDAMYLLDAPTVGDFAYRSNLLADRADTVAASGRDWFELRSEATEASIELADELDEMARRIEAAAQNVAIAQRVSAEAEYVAFIAAIHLEADQLQARNGRTDPTPAQWAEVRWCESRDTYDVATGNGFWGAYQFDLSTWADQGGTGLPSEATPPEQDARARRLYHDRGWKPWPICGRHLPQE